MIMDVEGLADRLRHAEETRTPCAPLTDEHPAMTLEDAYRVQAAGIARRLAAGATRVGRKIGITSAAVQQWLEVDHPDFGVLLEDMEVPEGGRAAFDRLIQPRVEGEVAFVLRRSLEGPVTTAQVLAAIDFAVPAIEIIDSRIVDWKVKLQDTVADNASCALYVLGTRPVDPRTLDLRMAGMTLRRNGEVVSTGAGAACMEHPVNAVVWLAKLMVALKDPLQAGEVILSGALGPVVPVNKTDWIEVTINNLGTVRTHF